MNLFRKANDGSKPAKSASSPKSKSKSKVAYAKKKQVSNLRQLISETNEEDILSAMEKNSDFIIGSSDHPEYVAIMLDNAALDEEHRLSKKTKGKNESIGSFIERINNEQLSAVGVPEFLDQEELILIPNIVTVENLNDFVDFTEPSIYPFTYVLLDDNFNLRKTNVPAFWSDLNELLEKNQGANGLLLKTLLPDFVPDTPDNTESDTKKFSEEEKTLSSSIDRTLMQEPMIDGQQIYEAEYANDAPMDPVSEQPEFVDDPSEPQEFEAETDFDPFANAIYPDDDTQDIASPQAESTEDPSLQPSSLNFSENRPDVEPDLNRLTFMQTENSRYENKDHPVVAKTYPDEMVAQTEKELIDPSVYMPSAEIFNIPELIQKEPLQFQLITGDSWYANEVNEMLTAFNSTLRKNHLQALRHLKEQAVYTFDNISNMIQQQYNPDNPETEIGKEINKIREEKSEALANSNQEIEKEQERLRSQYEENRNIALQNAAEIAGRQFDDANQRRLTKDLQRTENAVYTKIENQFLLKRRNALEKNRNAVQDRLKQAVIQVNHASMKDFKSFEQSQLKQFEQMQKEYESFAREAKKQHREIIAHDKALDDLDKKRREQSNEYQQKLNQQKTEYDMKKQDLENEFNLQIKNLQDRNEDNNFQIKRLMQQLSDKDNRLNELEKYRNEQKSVLEKEFAHQYEDQIRKLNQDKEEAEANYQRMIDTQKKFNATAFILGTGLVILCITVGLVIGMLINFNSQKTNSEPEQIQEEITAE